MRANSLEVGEGGADVVCGGGMGSAWERLFVLGTGQPLRLWLSAGLGAAPLGIMNPGNEETMVGSPCAQAAMGPRVFEYTHAAKGNDSGHRTSRWRGRHSAARGGGFF